MISKNRATECFVYIPLQPKTVTAGRFVLSTSRDGRRYPDRGRGRSRRSASVVALSAQTMGHSAPVCDRREALRAAGRPLGRPIRSKLGFEIAK
jgi:hypothetical protein